MGLLSTNRAKPADCPLRGTGKVPPQNSRNVAFELSFALISLVMQCFPQSRSLYHTSTLQPGGSACLGIADKGRGTFDPPPDAPYHDVHPSVEARVCSRPPHSYDSHLPLSSLWHQ